MARWALSIVGSPTSLRPRFANWQISLICERGLSSSRACSTEYPSRARAELFPVFFFFWYDGLLFVLTHSIIFVKCPASKINKMHLRKAHSRQKYSEMCQRQNVLIPNFIPWSIYFVFAQPFNWSLIHSFLAILFINDVIKNNTKHYQSPTFLVIRIVRHSPLTQVTAI